MKKLLTLALHHTRNGYAGPAAYHLGYVVSGDLLTYHGIAVLRRLQLVLYALDVVVELLQLAVADFSHTLVVAFTLSTLSLKLKLLNLLLVLLNLVDESLLALPLCAERAFLVAEFGNVLVELCNLVRIVLTLDGLTLYFELLQLTRNLVQLLRNGVTLHAELCGSLIHEVDGLIGKEAVRDVTLRELNGSDAGIVLYTNLVMVLVTLLQATQDADGRKLVRLVHHYGLETTLESLILLEVFLIFVKRRGTDASQFATGKSWLEDVGGIHSALAATSTDKRMNLIDEEDDATVRIGNLLDDALKTLLKLAFVLGTRNKRTHIQ